MFRADPSGADDIVMTPERFGWLQQALREMYEAALGPGQSAARPQRARGPIIARVNKLYLNGWDDLNGDQDPTRTTAAPATSASARGCSWASRR